MLPVIVGFVPKVLVLHPFTKKPGPATAPPTPLVKIFNELWITTTPLKDAVVDTPLNEKVRLSIVFVEASDVKTAPKRSST